MSKTTASDDDYRLVLDSIRQYQQAQGGGAEELIAQSPIAGHQPLSRVDAHNVIHELFGVSLSNEIAISVIPDAHVKTAELIVTYDLDHLKARMATAIASGILNDADVMALLPDMPTAVTDRIKYAHASPEFAEHYIQSAASHLTSALIWQIRQSLYPLQGHGSIIVWSGSITLTNQPIEQVGTLLKFARTVCLMMSPAGAD